jgi:hypothetical protein
MEDFLLMDECLNELFIMIMQLTCFKLILSRTNIAKTIFIASDLSFSLTKTKKENKIFYSSKENLKHSGN